MLLAHVYCAAYFLAIPDTHIVSAGMHKAIQDRTDIWEHVAIARKAVGLSQQALATKVGVNREAVARFEAGSGSVALLTKVMSAIPMRMHGVAKGLSIVDQIANARLKRKWEVQDVARATGLDSRTVRTVERGGGTIASLNVMLAKLAPRAALQQVAKIFWDYDRAKMTEADCRFTPPDFLAAVTDAFGAIDVDPCWHPDSNVVAVRTIALPECGLQAEWTSLGLVFVNPPYGNLAAWIAKMNDEWESGRIAKAIMLFPASRIDIREFFDRSAKQATTLLLRDRLRFSRLGGEQVYPAPFALALTCFGCTESELAEFRSRYPALVVRPHP